MNRADRMFAIVEDLRARAPRTVRAVRGRGRRSDPSRRRAVGGLLSARDGWCRLRDGGRGIRIDRIASAVVTAEPIDPPPLDELLRDVPLGVRRPAVRPDEPHRHAAGHQEE